MRRPSKKQLEGLSDLLSLADADVSVDPERWPRSHAVHNGLTYLRLFINVERERRHGDSQRNSKRRTSALSKRRAFIRNLKEGSL